MGSCSFPGKWCLLFFFPLLLTVCDGRFQDVKILETKEILLNYGAAHDTLSMPFVPELTSEKVISAQIINYDTDILTNADAQMAHIEIDGQKDAVNVTCNFSFESGVGITEYSLVMRTMDEANSKTRLYRMQGKYAVIGVALYTESGMLVTGEHAEGLNFGSYKDVLEKGARSLKLVYQSPLSSPQKFDLSKAQIRATPLTGSHSSGIVDFSSFSMNGNYIDVLPKPYRVSSIPEVVTLTYPECNVNGEVFETIVMVSVPIAEVPPPVVTGPDTISVVYRNESSFHMSFFNLMTPPQTRKVSSLVVFANGDNGRFTIASRGYKQPEYLPLEEDLEFQPSDLTESGTFKVQVEADFEDGGSILCHMQREIQLKVEATGTVTGQETGDLTTSASSDSVDGQSLTMPMAVVGGLVGFAVVAFIVGALIRYRNHRDAEMMESSFSKSGPLGVPTNFADNGGEFVLRDAYARTGSSLSQLEIDRQEEAAQNAFQRQVSTASSHVSF